MKSNFKFFRGYGNSGTLDLMDGQPYATASLYDPHHGIITHEQYMRNRDMLIEQERIRRLGMINHSRETDNQIRLFQATTTVTVNPTLWTKIKIFGTDVKLVLIETWRVEPIGVVVISILATLVTIIGIAKILSIW